MRSGSEKKGKKSKKKKTGKSRSSVGERKLKRGVSHEAGLTSQVSKPAPAAAARPVSAQLDAPPIQSESLSFFCGDTKLGLTHGSLFETGLFSDVSILFLVQGKKEVIQAHSCILDARSGAAFMTQSALVARSEKKNGHIFATITESALPFCNVDIVRAVMRYLYSGSISSVENASDLPFLINLLATAVAAGLVNSRLAWVTEQKVRALTSIETAHLILRFATDRGLESLKWWATDWAFSHWPEFISFKPGCRTLGMNLLSEVSASQARGEQVQVPNVAEPADNIIAAYKRMYESMPGADLALQGEQQQLCHRAILASFSPSLQRLIMGAESLLSPRDRRKGDKLAIGVSSPNGRALRSPAAVESFLRFVYYGECNMDPLCAVELTHAFCDFQLTSLDIVCEHTFHHGITEASAFPIMGITFMPSWVGRSTVQTLRNTCTEFIIAKFSDLDLNALPSVPPEVFHILQALQRAHAGVAASSAASSASISASAPPRMPPSPRPRPPPPSLALPRDSAGAPPLPVKPEVLNMDELDEMEDSEEE